MSACPEVNYTQALRLRLSWGQRLRILLGQHIVIFAHSSSRIYWRRSSYVASPSTINRHVVWYPTWSLIAEEEGELGRDPKSFLEE